MWRRIVGAVAVRSWLAFLLMGLFFFLFGVTSLNLVGIFRANITLILDYGVMALFDGALAQLVELLFYGYLSIAFFALFKICEKLLVERLTEHE